MSHVHTPYKEKKLSAKAKKAIKNYGEDVCRDLYSQHKKTGDDARTLAASKKMTTSQCNAAINAGREMEDIFFQETRSGGYLF